MTRYFMRDTPLCQMEQQMMTPPYFKPRGHGRYYPGFQYSRDDMECPYLPASKGQIERAMQRSGIADPKDMRLFIADSSFPEEVDVALDFQCDNIHELNELALAVEKFSIHDRKKLGAAVSMAKPENASQIRRLAENMDLFEFAPGAHTPEEYGKYMIQRSGHFEYDPNLDEFYDYERYGLQHMDYQSGVFTDRGYIAYVGTVDLEELMAEDPVDQCQREQGVQMGGMT